MCGRSTFHWSLGAFYERLRLTPMVPSCDENDANMHQQPSALLFIRAMTLDLEKSPLFPPNPIRLAVPLPIPFPSQHSNDSSLAGAPRDM